MKNLTNKQIQKRAKRTKRVKNKLANERAVFATKSRGFRRIRTAPVLKNKKIDQEAMAKMLRKTLGLADDDKTPIQKLVDAVNLKMSKQKEEPKA